MTSSIIEKITQLKEKCMLTEEQFRDCSNLSPSEYNAMMSIEEGESVKSNEFSLKMGLSPSRGSRVIEKLVKRGLIKSRKVRTDKRAIRLCLTEEGVTLRKELDGLKCHCDSKIHEEFSDEEIAVIEDSLDKLLSVL